MKITTLKTLIKDVFDKTNDIEEIKKSILELLTIYEMDNLPEPKFIKDRYEYKLPDEVPYHTICGCNPANGGNGICLCVNGNNMIPNPITYPGTTKSNTTI